MKSSSILIALLLNIGHLFGQDTYSIVAIDPETNEVGSAGASCVDLNAFALDADFLGELFPGVGAINSQAWYILANQENARTRMNAGDTPSEIIDWLIANDVQGNPDLRQYGVTAFVNGEPEAAAHTGANTDDWKGHRVGDNYSIQGNILLGDFIVDAMESNFINTDASLPEKLMAAMQGANVVGADTRCEDNGTSSLFSFLKVAQPDDVFGSPSLVLGVITADGAGIEPVDSLQVLFNEWLATTTSTKEVPSSKLGIYPNPSNDFLQLLIPFSEEVQITVFSSNGNLIQKFKGTGEQTLDLQDFAPGVYVVKVVDNSGRVMLARFVKE